jgi:hypothetical protein
MSTSAIVGGGVMMFLLIMLILWVMVIIARWKIFTKAGEKGWKSIIPIYGDYVQWRIGWQKTGLFWAYIALLFIGSLLISMGGVTSAQMYGSAAISADTLTNPALVGIGCLVLLVAAVLALVAAFKLFKSFYITRLISHCDLKPQINEFFYLRSSLIDIRV